MNDISHILTTQDFDQENLKMLLSAKGLDNIAIFEYAKKIKVEYVGNKVFLRGLIELSNNCGKNCFYCGIRGGNTTVSRYAMTRNEVVELVKNTYKLGLKSIVIQAGECTDKVYVSEVENILKDVIDITDGEMGITLSLGEQDENTYRRWKDAGAKRYLLRIETSDEVLYKKLHPKNHSFLQRVNCLEVLRKIGYQVGTGVMIGLPLQTIDNLVGDLLFFKKFDIDMIGMGPYIPHKDTPLYEFCEDIATVEQRFMLSLKMIALARIMMKDINIAATTALQTLEPTGREKAVEVGANIIMPNITPVSYRENYNLYLGKTIVNDDWSATIQALQQNLSAVGAIVAFGEQGDSKHFMSRTY